MAKDAKLNVPGADIEGADRQYVTALARGLEILRCFSALKPELGTTEIAQLTGLPQPTVWRLCHTLIKCGYLVPSPPIAASTTGWAYLAVIPAPQRAQLVQRMEAHYGRRDWNTMWQKASAAIKNYQKTGYILSGGAYDPEINAVAIPIQPDGGSQFFALTCGAPAAVIPVKTFQIEIAPRLMRVGEIIRSALAHGGSASEIR
jgi:DNA-binding IclR family transcriptional regulator